MEKQKEVFTLEQEKSLGYLVVRVTTADGAIPVEGALIEVSDAQGGGIVRILRSDNSGLTDRIALPTPEKELSQAPNGGVPYHEYNIRVTKDGYYGVSAVFVPIYPTVTSVQSIALLPLEISDRGGANTSPPPDDIFFDEGTPPNL